uniref:Guided entry of tail-anchored proteins factor 1 n=1 Tax=Phallusia mammillata TaxID=59560 RepID=A0A6F9DY20_9ASCI|nr:tail-anchored protein insertion receptor WRB [Phallusia mammillata]
MLFYIILFLSLIQNFLDQLVQVIVLALKYLVMKSAAFKDFASLQQELQEQIALQNEINMMDNFAKHARIQRKIDSLKAEITVVSTEMSKRVAYFRSILYWTLRVVIALSFMYIAFVHRYDPVMTIDEKFFPFPFLAWIVSFPTGVPGNIGCLFWVILCQLSVRSIRKYITS